MENFSQENPDNKEEPRGHKLISESKEKLGLKKPLKFYPRNDLSTLRCFIDYQDDEYIILGPVYFLEDPGSGQDLVHELCHFYLAEKLDPLFASAYLEKEQDTPDFRNRTNVLYLTTRFEDIWVNDTMREFFPDIHTQGIRETWKYVKKLIESGQEQLLLSNQEPIIALAMNIAERKRHQIEGIRAQEKEIMNHLFRKLGKKWKEMIEKYAEFFAALPSLSENTQESLKIYEESVRSFIQLNRFPIDANIIKNPDSKHIPHVWRVQWK